LDLGQAVAPTIEGKRLPKHPLYWEVGRAILYIGMMAPERRQGTVRGLSLFIAALAIMVGLGALVAGILLWLDLTVRE
jgi:hypothetical protein